VTSKKGEEVSIWIGECSGGSPGASWIRGLFALLDEWRLDAATEHLEQCLRECAAPPRDAIRVEASTEYLLFLIDLARAEAAGAGAERGRLLASAARHLDRAGEFDPASRETLIWREVTTADRFPEGGVRLACSRLRLRRGHPLVGLFRGTRLWTELFTGGTLEQFVGARADFDSVLAEYPRNVPALSFRARTECFFARTYEYFGLLEPAREGLDLALECGEPTPYFLNFVTRGQIDLLLGDPSVALDDFEAALRVMADSRSLAVHNTHRGMGEALTGLGETERAEPWFEKAAEHQPRDPGVCVAMVDRYLWIGQPEKALEVGGLAAGHQAGNSTGLQTRNADVYLALARAYLALEPEDEPAALESLVQMNQTADEHPRVFGQACLLLSTWPEEALVEESTVVRLVQALAGKAGRVLSYDAQVSPVCLAAQGIAKYIWAAKRGLSEGAYQEAIELLEAAEDARRETWTRELREYYWPESARDLYCLAVVHASFAADFPERSAEESARSRECYAEAERLRAEGTPHPESRDLLERSRTKAREFLGISD